MRSVQLQTDLHIILDERARTETGVLEEPTALCDTLDIMLILDPPHDQNFHWGGNSADSELIICVKKHPAWGQLCRQ